VKRIRDVQRNANLTYHEGRVPGVPNKLTKDLKTGIIDGAAAHGADGQGKDGLGGYLSMCATRFPKAYMQLLGKLVPMQLTDNVGKTILSVNINSVQHDTYLSAEDIERDKLDETVKSGEITYIHFDIRANERELERLTADHDVVVDLVAMANPSLYVSNPVDVFKLNFVENLKIAEFCVKHKKRIVQFSTCEVYGITSARAFGKDSSKHPIPFAEDETPLIMGPVKNHRWIYACAKQLLERVLHAYGLEEGLNYSIIRPFNFIGPRIDYLPSEQTGNPRVFNHFMNALLYGTPLKLVDAGRNYHAHTYIGTPENEVTIKELADKMQAIFDQHFRQPGDPYPEVVSVPSEEFYGKGYEDCDRRIPEVSKVRKLVGWRSKHDLESVLYHTMKYFVEKHRAKQPLAA
jgi:UDP-apiose/xylose synthase